MDKKISALNAVSSLTGTELLPVVQSGITKRATVNQVKALVLNSASLNSGYLPYWNGTNLVDSPLYKTSTAVLLGTTTHDGSAKMQVSGGYLKLQNGLDSLRFEDSGGAFSGDIKIGASGGRVSLTKVGIGDMFHFYVPGNTNSLPAGNYIDGSACLRVGGAVADWTGFANNTRLLVKQVGNTASDYGIRVIDTANADVFKIDGTGKGILTNHWTYNADYSGSYTSRSLVDKGYVDGADTSLQNQINNLNANVGGWKQPARVYCSTNITIASPGASLDGIAMNAGDRVVLNGQSTGSENGVYVWNGAAVAMTRATDCTTGDNSLTGVLGMVIIVEEGTQADKMFALSNNAPITVGTTALSFVATSASVYTGSTGVTLVGNDFRIDNTWFSGDATIDGSGVIAIGAGKVTNAMLAGSIAYSKLAAMTSAELATVVNDETGSGALVFGTSPTLTTPTIIASTDTMGDANKTYGSGVTEIQLTSALTATRTLTLPAANAFARGTKLRFTDAIGGISYTNTVTLTRAGTDTINGATTKTLNVVYGVYEFITDGTSKWTVNILTSYLENTYATTHTGFSTDPTATMYYFLNGNMCTILYQPTINGTSNAATFTLTLPFNAHASMANLAVPVRVFDNGVAATGRVVFASGSNVLTIHPSITGTTWTASGTKAVSLAITFRIA
jgi:hypothetical protein